MSERKGKQNCDDEKIVELRIADHPVRLSFSAAQRVRNCLIDSFLRQDTAKRGAA